MFNNLRNLLRTKNISIAAYSRILGCNEKTVQNKLNGTTEFTLSEIKATLDIFPEFKLEYLFAIERQPAQQNQPNYHGAGGRGQAGVSKRLFSERGVSGVKMSLEQKEKVIKDLIAFIERVSEGKTTSDTETLVLPDVVKALVNLSSLG